MIGYQSQEHHFNLFVTPENIEKMTTEAICGKVFLQFESNSVLGLEVKLSKNEDSITEFTDTKGVIFKLDLKLGMEKYALLKERGQVNIQGNKDEITLTDSSKICGWTLDTYNYLQQRA